MKNQEKDFPFEIKVSFKKVINAYKERAKVEQKPIAKTYLQNMLAYIKGFPKLETGIENPEELKKHSEPIKILLDDLFPNILTNNEIKAASIPSSNIIFNTTKRFDEIINNAGAEFILNTRNLKYEFNYIYGCILILNHYYQYTIDFTRPFYFDIPDKNGIMRHYRLAVNADFIEFEPTEKAIEITDDIVDRLLQNTEDIDLWKEMFPPLSWIFNGFVILNLTDVTVDDGISDLKTELLKNNIPEKKNVDALADIFRSIYKISDLQVGFTMVDSSTEIFFKMNKDSVESYILDDAISEECNCVLSERAYSSIMQEHNYFTIPNMEKFAAENPNSKLAKNLLSKKVKSCIFAPITKGNELLAVLELVSYRKNELNSINAIKLEDILPYIITAVERNKAEFENKIKAVIQSECTSIHPSVLWRFEEEAKRYIRDMENDGVSSFRDIAFKDIYPLYGQIDIVSSSEERNNAIQRDLLKQLEMIGSIINKAYMLEALPIYEQASYRIKDFTEDVRDSLSASSEQKIFNFIHREIDPLIEHLEKQFPSLKEDIQTYIASIDKEAGVVYDSRKDYDVTVQRINRTLARYIDSKQQDAQKIYPHYFERYKTDGVDHNIYIGKAMVKNKAFNEVYLYNLRLWQLQVMCEMENKFYQLQKETPLTLNAASLILVFNSTLSIRYRMDEKKFDVDGTYNARYEIIKKRIDKAYIKDTEERITRKGKLAIIYSQKSDEREYMRYIKYLQDKNYLGESIELLELEDVQGIIGLKAIRVEILYHKNEKSSAKNNFTYEDLMKELH